MLKEELKQKIIAYRQTLHQIPELGFTEYKTQAFLHEELTSLGYTPIVTAKTGLYVFIKGETDETIAFRSDIDALPIMEQTNLPYSSTHEGKMHACGHDGHMSILLGFANFLKNHKLKKNVLLIFQPAEEGPGGAKVIVDEGILSKYNVSQIFGLHLFPEINEDMVGLANGPLMAQVGEIDLTIHGKSAHGAMPQKGVDAIVALSSLVQSYQSIISRTLNPLDTGVVTIGKVSGGDARNIICEKVVAEGTIRAHKQEVYEMIKQRILEINKGLALMYNVQVDTLIRDMYPALVNDKDLHNFMISILNKDEYIEVEPLMIAEDFSYYLQEVPGYFILLGCKNEELGFAHPLHSSCFNFAEKVLFKGVELYIRISQGLNII